ncbi:phosphoribosylamine--glycine ligase [Fodinisporobacter ferrooxydans]|uniref:Phosphoribosylamine--glycine ligase n=1 Tax=Fodinisporobacter ferrooxydans TaxID=2901836 RepID=A0ABY4CPP3_9BACL|nr:phosphoribosylamine--glycine ligase [Alicyclobacillaceae bacterium MYW30-H2]
MKILVVGSGGREHALVWKLAQSPHQPAIYCAPGNPGIAALATCVPIQADDVEQLAKFAKEERIDLTVVGPEVALAKGIVDLFEQQDLLIFGPRKAGAQIESSKSWAKQLMLDAGVPTAAYRVFTDLAQARDFILKETPPVVLKADGLAAGKGVVVAQSTEEALSALDDMMANQVFGQAGAQVVVEQYLTGPEATLLAFVDGTDYVLMVPAQDHKPVFDDNKGPNTGGMGTYSPVPDMTDDVIKQVETTIVQPILQELKQRGIHYKGVLYTGLMLTADGPYVIEFNARFGDPETQVVLPRLKTDLVDICLSIAQSPYEDQDVDQDQNTVQDQEKGTGNPKTPRLSELKIEWFDNAAVCVVITAAGYPGNYKKGDMIAGLAAVETARTVVFHAGTAWQDGAIVTNGGRVLGVTGFGETLQQAREQAYAAVHSIEFAGMHYRTDIGKKAMERSK